MSITQDHLVSLYQFLSKYDAKDKLTALIQYGSMYVADGEAGIAKNLQVKVTGARKVFRVGNETGPIKSLLAKPNLGSGPFVLELLEKVRLISTAQYYVGNHIALLGDIGMITDKEFATQGGRSSYWGWCIGSACSAFTEAYHAANLAVSRREGEDDKSWEARKAAAQEELQTRLMAVLHNASMVVLALGLLGKVQLKQRTMGLLGMFSALVSCYKMYPALPSSEKKVDKSAPVTMEDVLAVQAKWGAAIANISKVYKEGGDFVGSAANAAGELYAYGHSNVLFKPTKATEHQFRPTGGEAMSYFVGGDVVPNGYGEDHGFAINGGKGWKLVKHNNHQIDLKGGIATAMGTYDFTCATTGAVSSVEYTFGYTRCDDGKVRIFLHHSSVPYEPHPAPVSKEEVLAVQSAWSGAIVRISRVHKEGGDFVGAAARAAGELYAYGHSNVLFKPTKAADYQFRPTAEGAMSYFVGGDAIPNGLSEDHGFAINGGKGWSVVTHKNHQIDLKGGIALAMGTYDFTCATTGAVATVEYTFGYTRCNDGKVRIFLHHSSLPYVKH